MNKNPETWTTKLYDYRVRVEHDEGPSCPWEDYDGQLGNVKAGSYVDFDLPSGDHNQDKEETLFWKHIDLYTNRDNWFISVTLTDAAEKYIKLMGKPHQGRFELVQWINENLEAEAKVAAQYLDGECYGFIIERRELINGATGEPWDENPRNEKEWQGVESCWGFFGEVYEGAYDTQSYIDQDAETFSADAIGANI